MTTTSRDSIIFHGLRSHFDKASAIFDELNNFASVNSAILIHILDIFCSVILLE
jgi:hypothetical protein